MTLAAGTNPEDDNKAPGTSLAPATETSGVDPFLAATSEKTEPEAGPRPLRAKLLDYSAHAAMVVGLLGFAWTISEHVVNRPAADAPVVAAKAPEKKIDPVAELRDANQRMAAEIEALHRNVDTLRAAVKEDKTPAQIRVLQAGLDNVRTGLAATRTETTSAIAQLSGKVEKIGRDPTSKMQQLVDRLGRLEHQTVDTTSTGSLPPPAQAPRTVVAKASPLAVPTPPAKPEKLADKAPEKSEKFADRSTDEKSATDEAAKPQILAGWVVRDVYDGVALIEGKRGELEVVPGVAIPGAGVVKSIDRHGSGWTVTTTKGQLAYAAPAAPREYRRGGGPRDFYPGYRYDF